MGTHGASRPAKTAAKTAKAALAAKSAVKIRKTVPLGAAKSALDTKSDRDQPYHHGDLHEALLLAAKRVADREGLQGLTLRAVAREAGVSHAAPAHHFGDITGLLSELAAIGFQRFSTALSTAAKAVSNPDAAAEARARAYVGFARENPCMFQLMFRAEKLDHERPALREAAADAFANLARVVGEKRHETVKPDHLTLGQAADIARVWSMVHGFAMLRIDGRLAGILAGLPPGTSEEELLAAMLKPDGKSGC